MTHQEIDNLLQEATKSYVDDSLSHVHSKLQDALTSEHRSSYSGDDWKDYPQVHHVFGDKSKGHVVYHQGDSHYRAPYKEDNGGYSLGASQPVQMAYVPAQSSLSEALQNHPEALEIMERYISSKERRNIPEEDFAGKGRSFPISKAADVRAALDSIGRAGAGNHAPDELKKRILDIAKRKGFAVPKSDNKKEEKTEESLAAKDGAIEFQESTPKTGERKVRLTLIRAGRGSMGYYSEEALKKAADDNIFVGGIKQFLNHQTMQERRDRPEGDIRLLAGKLDGKAQYVKESGKPGALVCDAIVYPDFAPFIEARKNDIGVSVRVGVDTPKKEVDGLPYVEGIKYAISVDYVTAAGAGGKIDEMYESFRQTESKNPQRSIESMTEQELAEFKKVQESSAKLALRLDRVEEENNQLRAATLIQEALIGTGISPRGQKRIRTSVLASLPLKDGVLDTAKLQESVKEAVTEEVAYLQEAGVRVSPARVLNMGGGSPVPNTSDENDKVLAESSKLFDASINTLMGRKEKTA